MTMGHNIDRVAMKLGILHGPFYDQDLPEITYEHRERLVYLWSHWWSFSVVQVKNRNAFKARRPPLVHYACPNKSISPLVHKDIGVLLDQVEEKTESTRHAMIEEIRKRHHATNTGHDEMGICLGWTRMDMYHKMRAREYVCLFGHDKTFELTCPRTSDARRFLCEHGLDMDTGTTSERSRYIPQTVRDEVMERDKHCCVVCFSEYKLEIDHILPHSRGGTNGAGNLQVLCWHCNNNKRAKTMDEWVATLGPHHQSRIRKAIRASEDAVARKGGLMLLLGGA